jgi:hypothetical protein
MHDSTSASSPRVASACQEIRRIRRSEESQLLRMSFQLISDSCVEAKPNVEVVSQGSVKVECVTEEREVAKKVVPEVGEDRSPEIGDKDSVLEDEDSRDVDLDEVQEVDNFLYLDDLNLDSVDESCDFAALQKYSV